MKIFQNNGITVQTMDLENFLILLSLNKTNLKTFNRIIIISFKKKNRKIKKTGIN
jgi:hypothetical protein